MWFLSFACLVFVAVACIAAVFSKVFKDNWPQFLGLWLLCLGVSTKAIEILQAEAVPPLGLCAHVGLALFAGGTWHKFRALALAGRAHDTDRIPRGWMLPGLALFGLLLATTPATSIQMAGNVITLDNDELQRCRAEGGCAVATQEAFDAAVHRSVVRQMRVAGKCA